MILPNWFRILWWCVLLAIFSAFIYQRWHQLVAGNATAFDMLVLSIFIGIALAPLFSEMSILGVTLKQQIKEVGNKVERVSSEVGTLRMELSQNIANHSNVFVGYPSPLPDSKLPEIKRDVQKAVRDTVHAMDSLLKTAPVTHSTDALLKETPAVPEGNIELFKTRFQLEEELRRLTMAKLPNVHFWANSRLSPMKSLNALVTANILSPDLAKAVEELHSVCSDGMHVRVTDAKVKLVRDVSPELLGALRTIRQSAEIETLTSECQPKTN